MDARSAVALEYRCGSLRGVTAVFRAVYKIDIFYVLKLFPDIVYIRVVGGGGIEGKDRRLG
jgi:hypothetical protein